MRLRAAALCSFAYVVVFVSLQLYLPQLLNGDQLHAPANAKIDDSVAALLSFVHRHESYFSTGYVLMAVTYVLLIGPAVGTYLLLRPRMRRWSQGVLVVALLGLIGTAISQTLTARELINWASPYAAAATAARRLTAVHGFEQSYSGYQIATLACAAGLALWLALLGAAFVRIGGMRNVVGWSTVAAGVLLISQLPSLPVWALGAGIGLWRLASRAGLVPQAEVAAEQIAAVQTRSATPRAAPDRRAASGGKAHTRTTGKRRKR